MIYVLFLFSRLLLPWALFGHKAARRHPRNPCCPNSKPTLGVSQTCLFWTFTLPIWTTSCPIITVTAHPILAAKRAKMLKRQTMRIVVPWWTRESICQVSFLLNCALICFMSLQYERVTVWRCIKQKLDFLLVMDDLEALPVCGSAC